MKSLKKILKSTRKYSTKHYKRAAKTTLLVVTTLAATLLAHAFSDVVMRQFNNFGSPVHITCVSSGRQIYDGTTTGRTTNYGIFNVWYFREAGTLENMRVAGDCVIRDLKP